jgi:hypothetical protein
MVSSHWSGSHKPIGEYLIEAGLLTHAQVDVILTDQVTAALPFGEIVTMRGWVKEQTIEYLMRKIIVPERKAATARQTVNAGNVSPELGPLGDELQANMMRQPRRTYPGSEEIPMVKISKTTFGGKGTDDAPTAEDPEDAVKWVG